MILKKIALLLIALFLGLVGAFAQVNPNIPARLDWVGYAGNPIEKSLPLLRSDSAAVITIQARAGKLTTSRLLAVQPVILSRTVDSLYVRIPPSKLLPETGGWVEVLVNGIVRFAGGLVISKEPRAGTAGAAISYVIQRGRDGRDADTATITALQSTAASASAAAASALSMASAASVSLQTIISVLNYPSLDAALTAATGRTLTIPNGDYLISGDLIIPANTTVRGESNTRTNLHFTGAGRLILQSGSRIENSSFIGTTTTSAPVTVSQATPQRGWAIVNCRFAPTFGVGISITGTADNGTHESGEVSDCIFESLTTCALNVIRINNSRFLRNTVVNPTTGRGLLFFGGQRNEIALNTVTGGITGINFIYHRSTAGGLGAVIDNNIHHNTVTGQSEESISLDGRFNEPTNTSVIGTDVIASKSISGSTYQATLSAAGWTTFGSNLVNYYAAFLTGSLKGNCYRITAHSTNSATITLGLTATEYALLSPGDQLSVGAAMQRNTIAENVIESATKTAAIFGYGFCYNTTVSGNKINYTGTGEQLVAAIPIAAIALSSVTGINATGSPSGLRLAPSENNTISNNTALRGNITVNLVRFGSGVTFLSSGNQIQGNKTTGSIAIDYNEDNAVENKTTLGYAYTNATPRPAAGTFAPTLTEKTAGFLVASADANKIISFGSASAGIATIPNSATDPIPLGSKYEIVQSGSGKVVIGARSGVTLYSEQGKRQTRYQGARAVLTKMSANAWSLSGDLDSSLPLDGLNPQSAFSMRRLSAAYSGPAMRVRRSSDEAETDIYYDATNFVSATSTITGGGGIVSWAGSSTLSVTTLYNQIGGVNFTSPVAAEQPILYLSGSVKSGGGAYVRFTQATHRMSAGNTASYSFLHTSAGSSVVLSVGNVVWTSGVTTTLLSSGNNGNQVGLSFRTTGGVNQRAGSVYAGGALSAFSVTISKPSGVFERAIIRHGTATTPNFSVTDNEIATSGSYANPPSASATSSTTLTLGHAQTLSSTAGFDFDELVIFSRTLSDDELTVF